MQNVIRDVRHRLFVARCYVVTTVENHSSWLFPVSIVAFAGYTGWAFIKSRQVKKKNESLQTYSKLDVNLGGFKDQPKVNSAVKFNPMSEEDREIAMGGVIKSRPVDHGSSETKNGQKNSSIEDSSDSDSIVEITRKTERPLKEFIKLISEK